MFSEKMVLGIRSFLFLKMGAPFSGGHVSIFRGCT